MDNSQIRKDLLLKRRKIELEDRERRSKALVKSITEDPLYRACDTIYLYMPTSNELDTEAILIKALNDNKTVAVPVVMTSQDMVFEKINGNPGFKLSKHNILEPIYDPKLIIDKKGLMIVPCVGYEDKNRIGYGMSYYNNYLKSRKHIYSIGVCYKELESNDYSFDERDIRLDEMRTF